MAAKGRHFRASIVHKFVIAFRISVDFWAKYLLKLISKLTYSGWSPILIYISIHHKVSKVIDDVNRLVPYQGWTAAFFLSNPMHVLGLDRGTSTEKAMPIVPCHLILGSRNLWHDQPVLVKVCDWLRSFKHISAEGWSQWLWSTPVINGDHTHPSRTLFSILNPIVLSMQAMREQ